MQHKYYTAPYQAKSSMTRIAYYLTKDMPTLCGQEIVPKCHSLFVSHFLGDATIIIYLWLGQTYTD